MTIGRYGRECGRHSRYRRIVEYLAACEEDEAFLTFAAIEHMIDGPLPVGAYGDDLLWAPAERRLYRWLPPPVYPKHAFTRQLALIGWHGKVVKGQGIRFERQRDSNGPPT